MLATTDSRYDGISGITRLGNRGDRVSDFSLQMLRFSAPCGPN